jgi:hypothetical protein
MRNRWSAISSPCKWWRPMATGELEAGIFGGGERGLEECSGLSGGAVKLLGSAVVDEEPDGVNEVGHSEARVLDVRQLPGTHRVTAAARLSSARSRMASISRMSSTASIVVRRPSPRPLHVLTKSSSCTRYPRPRARLVYGALDRERPLFQRRARRRPRRQDREATLVVLTGGIRDGSTSSRPRPPKPQEIGAIRQRVLTDERG